LGLAKDETHLYNQEQGKKKPLVKEHRNENEKMKEETEACYDSALEHFYIL